MQEDGHNKQATKRLKQCLMKLKMARNGIFHEKQTEQKIKKLNKEKIAESIIQ